MAASNTDLFTKVGNPGSATNLAAPGHGIGETSITVVSTSNWPTTTGVIFAMDTVSTVQGKLVRDVNSYTEWSGVVTSATGIGSLVLRYGTDQNYPSGATTRVYIPVASSRENRLVDGLLVQHNQDGTHSAAVGAVVLPLVYPVGSVYINATNATNPATLLGFGTWIAFGSGRVPVGIDTTQTEFTTIGQTGGEKTHVLTTAEMPSHSHTPLSGEFIASNGSGGSYPSQSGANWGFRGSATTATAGSGTAHNVLQPYVVVYMWKRTA